MEAELGEKQGRGKKGANGTVIEQVRAKLKLWRRRTDVRIYSFPFREE